MILQRIFLGINPCFLHREFHNLQCEDQLYFCVMISHMSKVEWSILPKTNMMCETFHKQNNKKIQSLKYLVGCTLYSKFSVQPVNGKSAKYLSLLRNPMDVLLIEEQQFSATAMVSQLIDDGLILSNRWFCSSGNCYCFLWNTCKLKSVTVYLLV